MLPGTVKQKSSFCRGFMGRLNHSKMDRIRGSYPACKTANPACDASYLLSLCLVAWVQPCLAARKRARTSSHLPVPSPGCTSSPAPRRHGRVTAWARGGDGAGTPAGRQGRLLPHSEGSARGLVPLVRGLKSLPDQPVTPAARQR